MMFFIVTFEVIISIANNGSRGRVYCRDHNLEFLCVLSFTQNEFFPLSNV